MREKAAFEKLNASAPYRVGDEGGKTETDSTGQERPIIVGHYTAIVWRATTHIAAARLEFELADDQGNARTYSAIVDRTSAVAESNEQNNTATRQSTCVN